ncbi:hypothetical protein CYMTET_40972 [Cymbomonas tetramitiformis]|uniref:Uncharacterized protein n=1 Tax=Cymbomonas tetramitiformis TaxID=36881 RepID=A0AAE0C707_9CHLO|nr:hypothetical protein CYMTET_40975 [Cymbomonas tetramitiformis]KAK3249604.1 hypothetical protein CYMTET_40972 [Cymbomonas tetramitiformis]
MSVNEVPDSSSNTCTTRDTGPPFVVVVLGATGVGKSRLAIDIASEVDGEVVNADALQVYAGLSITTNQVPEEERRGIEHHLLGHLDLTTETTVRSFRDQAVPIIDDIVKRQKVPVIVGGSNYYIQALVTQRLVDEWRGDVVDITLEQSIGSTPTGNQEESEALLSPASSPSQPGCDLALSFARDALSMFSKLCTPWAWTAGEAPGDVAVKTVQVSEVPRSLDTASNQELGSPPGQDNVTEVAPKEESTTCPEALYQQLQQIDPVAAERLHPNNTRRVARYLEIYNETGRLPSEIFMAQQLQADEGISNARYRCCFVWVQVEPEALSDVVAKRVDVMMERGLLHEIAPLHKSPSTFTHGVSQAIGVREFEPYFRSVLPEGSPSTVAREALPSSPACLHQCVDHLKLNTLRLAKRQVRRISTLEAQLGWKIQKLDSTGALIATSQEATGLHWRKSVVEPAVMYVRQQANAAASEDCRSKASAAEPNGSPRSPAEAPLVGGSQSTKEIPPEWVQHTCEACGGKVLRGQLEWQAHLQGSRHKKRMASLRKRQRASQLAA